MLCAERAMQIGPRHILVTTKSRNLVMLALNEFWKTKKRSLSAASPCSLVRIQVHRHYGTTSTRLLPDAARAFATGFASVGILCTGDRVQC